MSNIFSELFSKETAFNNSLKRFAKKNGAIHLKDITLEIDNKSETIKDLLLTKSHVIILTSLNYKGDLYGTVKDNNWALHEKDYKTPLVNPINTQNNAISVIRSILPKEDIYKINIDNYVVFLNSMKKLAFYSNIKNCLYLNDFKKMLNQKYTEDRGVKPEVLKKAFLKYKK